MADIQITSLKKEYTGGKVAVSDFSLDILSGEFIVLLGGTGSGKTAVLRMLCGLDEVTEGEIKLGGKVINETLPKDRDMAVVFKSIGLYPHLNVYDNLAFSLKVRKVAQSEIDERVNYVAKIFGLENVMNKKPKMISAHERARAMIARALVRNSNLILMDDPLNGYDDALRSALRNEILKLQQRVKCAVVYATRDAAEALTLADRIVFMEEGKIVQVGTPEELYSSPATVSVATYIGSPRINLIDGAIEGVDKPFFTFGDNKIAVDKQPQKRAYLAFRAEDVTFEGDIPATIRSCEKLDEDKYLVAFTVAGQKNDFYAFSATELSGDERIGVSKFNLYDAQTENLL